MRLVEDGVDVIGSVVHLGEEFQRILQSITGPYSKIII